jgi:hypothetical protein
MKFVIVAIAIALAGSAIHPFGPVKTANAPMDGPPMDAESAAIIARACANCHTERVTWPWYGYVAPVSWLLEKDVSEARSHMNLSRWGRYSQSETEVLLSAIGAAVRTGEMPPARYQVLHPEAKLSPAEREHLYQWTRAEKRRMRSASSR